jgi:hypothetical protein
MTAERAQDVIDSMAEERRRLVAWVRDVPQEHWGRLSPDGIWQARDYVAHLASIDPLLTALMRIFQSGGEPGGRGSDGRPFSIDDWNEGQILERRSRSVDDLLADLERSRVDLNAALADFTDEQLERTFRFGGDKSRSPRDVKVHEFLNGLVHHDRWHMEDARRAIEGEPEQPFNDASFERALRERPGP